MRQATLNIHGITHVGQQPQCTDCGKSFTESRHLQRHMFSHTGENPLKCTVCYQIFKDQKQLRDHIKIHYEYK